MKATKRSTVTLELSGDEANWLMQVMRNPVYNPNHGSTSESTMDNGYRQELFNVLGFGDTAKITFRNCEGKL